MLLVSWNVNGLRALAKKNGWDWFLNNQPDILCLQETKAHPDQLPEEIRNPLGYFSYFDHSKAKKGYSGVAIFSKIKAEKVVYGFGNEKYDQEGRFLELHFTDFVLINCYFPNGGGGEDRLQFKLKFYDLFLKHIEKLRKDGKKIIFCGDVNTAHNEIDIARPKENENNTGFLQIEKDWLDKVVANGYVDTFRALHPDKKEAYTWWDMKTFARDRNVGWRIDYFFVSSDLLPQVKKAEILSDVFGSDHCPILIELK